MWCDEIGVCAQITHKYLHFDMLYLFASQFQFWNLKWQGRKTENCEWPLHFTLCSITLVASKVPVILQSFIVSTWMRNTIEFSVACDTMEFEFIALSPPLVWFTPRGLPGRCGNCIHQHSTSGIRRRGRRHCSYWHMAQCEGMNWLLWWFAWMTKFVI